jgi:hypothetical protein
LTSRCCFFSRAVAFIRPPPDRSTRLWLDSWPSHPGAAGSHSGQRRTYRLGGGGADGAEGGTGGALNSYAILSPTTRPRSRGEESRDSVGSRSCFGWRSRNAPSSSRTNWRWRSVTSTLDGSVRGDSRWREVSFAATTPLPVAVSRVPVHGRAVRCDLSKVQERDEEDASAEPTSS